MKKSALRLSLIISLLSMCASGFSQTITETIVKKGKRILVKEYHITDTFRSGDQRSIIDTIIRIESIQPVHIPPDYLGKAMMTPSAWGANRGGILFIGLGGTFPQIYNSNPDLISGAGLTIGNANKYLGAR